MNHLFIGIGGHIVCLDPSTGSEIWRSKLKGADTVTFSLQDNRLYAGTGGELFCLDARSGTVLWHNKLKGLGLGLVSFGGEDDLAGGDLAARRRRAAASGAT